jgi:hypothetical protein
MQAIAIEDLDLSPFLSAPMLSSEASYALSMELDARKPADAPPPVLDAAAQMVTTAQAIGGELRRRVEDPRCEQLAQLDVLDLFVDRLWTSTRAQLDAWAMFADPAVDELSPALHDQLDLAGRRAQAALAEELSAHLFGELGQGPFAEQLAVIASRIEFVRTSAKARAYAELIGPERLAALELTVDRYRAMLRDRADQTGPSSPLRPLRRKLQRQITRYAASVLGLIEDDDPSSVATVLAALQPLVAAQRGRVRSEDQGYPIGDGRAPIAPPPAYASGTEPPGQLIGTPNWPV